MNILIVDDRQDSRYLLEVLLTGSGHRVRSAANGAEAFDLIGAAAFDLIISDILMPVMDGFALCRKLKADDRYKNIPFIVYTATYTGQEDETFAISLGAARFLRKPCEPDALLEAIDQVMAAARQGDGPALPEPASEEVVFKLYNERLVRKLEQKMLQLEKESQARRQSETKYRRLLEGMRDGFAWVDMQGKIQAFNESYRNMLGYSAETLAQLTYMDLTPAQWHAFEQRIVEEQVQARGFSEVYEKEYRRADGTIFPVELRTLLIQDDAGNNAGMWAIVRDVSLRKQADAEKQQLQAQLLQAQKLEAIGRLAGGVAHDFNNLLTVILGYGDLLLAGLPQAHPQAESIKQICAAGLRARDLTRQLLAFSRKQVLEMIPGDINQVVQGFEKLLCRLIGEDVQLHLALADRALPVVIDIGQIEQVLMNLAVNARDAMPDGGHLTIETAAVALDHGYAKRKPDVVPGNYAMIMIRDTGCGMGPEVLNHIFDPFFTTKGPEKGTGLGLATSYGIVKQHGGHIWVYSEPGCGTTFKIYLPLLSDAIPGKEEPLPVPPRITGVATVMIVEDDPTVRSLACRILEHAGYHVMAPAAVAEAIDEASRCNDPIHLILADVVMPGMKGPEVVERIARHHPEARVLYVSGYPATAVTGHGVLNEGVQFLSKPFTRQGLLDKVAQVLAT